MGHLQQQIQHLRNALQCSATLEHVTPHLWICHLTIPWCGRQLHWQVLIPAAPHAAPDVLLDDDSFNPLCDPPLPHHPYPHSRSLEQGPPAARPTASRHAAALRALLRSWATPAAASSERAPARPGGSVSPPLSSDAGGALSRLQPQPQGPPPPPPPPPSGSLVQLVCLLLEAYRELQLGRLAAAAAGLPRLQFELSTLEPGPGVLAELQQHQACFSLRLPPLDLRRFLELAEQYGAVLPAPGSPGSQLPTEPPAAVGTPARPFEAEGGGAGPLDDPGALWQPPAEGHAALGPGSGADLLGHPDVRVSGAVGPGGLESRWEKQRRQQQQQQQLVAGVAAGSSSAGVAAPLPSGLEFTLLASFRLPGGGGGLVELGEPALELQLPRALRDLKAREGGSDHIPSASAAGSGAAGPTAPSSPSPSSSSSAPSSSSPALVPSFLLPPWSPHMCLAEYVPLAAERLQAQLDAHCTVLAARQQLYEQLAEVFGPPLELNPRDGAALFVVSWETTPVLVSLELGPRFPTDKPTLVLQCARVLPGAESCRTYRDYPWSPRWGPAEMAARIHNWLKEELPNFTRGRVPQP